MTGTPGTRASGTLAALALAVAGCLLILGVAAQTAHSEETAAPSVDDVLTRMRAAYQGQPSVQAAFVQTNTGMSYLEPMVMKGTLELKKPRRIRMEYTAPRAKTYLSDGATLWVIDDADRTVTRSKTQVDAVGRLFDFLTGAADVKKDFVVTLETGPEKAANLHVLRMKPKSPDAGVAMVYMQVHPDTGLVQGVVTVTPFGDRSETALADVRTDVTLPDARFVYADIEGFRLVDLD